MRNITKLIYKDFLRFFADIPALIFTFVVPIVLIIIFGSIWGSGSKSRGKIPMILINKSNNELSKYIETELDSSSAIRTIKKYIDENKKEQNFTIEKAKEFVKNGKIPAALIMPKDFFADTSSSLKFKYYFDPRNEMEMQLLQGTIQQTVFSKIPEIFPLLMQRQAKTFLNDSLSNSFNTDMANMISEYFGVDKDEIVKSLTEFDMEEITSSNDSTEAAGTDFISNLIQFDEEQLVGTEVKNPGVTRIVGGWAIMFLLFTLTATATSIFEERKEGTLKRILCMSVTRTEYLISKYFYSIIIGIIQLFVLFFFAYIFYDVDIFSNFFSLIIVILASAGASVAFGMLITAIADSLAQANGFATPVILIMSALGGSWFPVSLFPDWMQGVAKFTLTYWSVEAFLQVLWRDAGISKIIFPYLTILLGIAIIVNYIALRIFNKKEIL